MICTCIFIPGVKYTLALRSPQTAGFCQRGIIIMHHFIWEPPRGISPKNKTCSETSGDGYHGNPCCTRAVTDIRRKINNDGDQFYGMLLVHFVPRIIIAHYYMVYICSFTYVRGWKRYRFASHRTCPRLINNIVSGGYGIILCV